MPQITNRMRRVFIVAAVAMADDPGKQHPAIAINPGATEHVPAEQWAALRKHSPEIFDNLVDGRHLTVDGDTRVHADELQNTAPPVAPEELDIVENPADNLTLSRKTDAVEVQLDGDAPAEAARPARNPRKA